MKKICLDENVKKIHFIGIGGISMSSLAEVLHKSGYIVTGSDRSESKQLNNLKNIGIEILNNHSKENIKDDIDLVVYTAAIKEDNEELIAAKDKNIKTIDRAEMLGRVMKEYNFPICVSGTHGKTTTTSMLAEIFLTGELDPSISVGGYYKSVNAKFGDSEYFVVESCEYYDSFLKFYPYVGIILNIEADHLDYFNDLEQIEDSFNGFAKNISEDGALIINNTIKDIKKIVDNIKSKFITFGNDEADYNAKNISYGKFGEGSYDLHYKDDFCYRVNLSVAGFHNILNSLSVIATCKYLGISDEIILKGLKNFKGPDRRFQIKGEIGGVTVVDDYAHHPTEIKSTLEAAKRYEHNKIIAVFQPHTYTRTKALLDEFARAFDLADEIIILDIYAAREKDPGDIHSKDLIQKITERGKKADYASSFSECVKLMSDKFIDGDLLITMGAGDVYLVGEMLLKS